MRFSELLIVVEVLALLIVLRLLFGIVRRSRMRARGRKRGANAHVNLDGSPKRRYRSARAAARAARDYERDFGERMHSYRCRRGRHWHIGHAK